MAESLPPERPDAGDALVVVIIDDHPMVREALALAVERAAPDADIRAFGGLGALHEALGEDGLKPDVVLLDLDLGDGGDFSNLTTVLSSTPLAPVAIVSATEAGHAIAAARDLGAAGYLRKSAGLEELTQGIRALIAGDLVFPSDLPAGNGRINGAAQKLASLTPTQAKVFEGLRRGLLNKQIAYELNISLSTTKAHMTAIFKKLGVYNRTQALLLAQDLNLGR